MGINERRTMSQGNVGSLHIISGPCCVDVHRDDVSNAGSNVGLSVAAVENARPGGIGAILDWDILPGPPDSSSSSSEVSPFSQSRYALLPRARNSPILLRAGHSPSVSLPLDPCIEVGLQSENTALFPFFARISSPISSTSF